MEKLLGIRDVYMKTVMSSNYQGDIFYTSDQVFFCVLFMALWLFRTLRKLNSVQKGEFLNKAFLYLIYK